MALETCKRTIGDYELLQLIAEGGMGTVHRGRHRQTGQVVAIKIMPPHLAKNPVLMKRFEKEYNAARAIDHANIVRAIEFGVDDGAPYLVMEFVDGASLGQRLERDGPLSEQEAIRIIAQVAQGLHRAHKKKLVHRDVKPDNILITPDGQAKLTDLGLVKETETDMGLTRPGRGLGTPHFMAPEQFRNAKNADARCDIYSLAATMYQMVTGVLPFQSTGPVDALMKKMNNDLVAPRKIVPELSERLEWAILRGMNPNRDNRPGSCREFVEDLTGHSTRRMTPLPAERTDEDRWYLVYTDGEGVTHTAKGSLQGIRRSLKDSRLGHASAIRVSRSKQGPFEPLRQFPEFRDLALQSGPMSTLALSTTPSPVSSPTPPPKTKPTLSVEAPESSSSVWSIPIPPASEKPRAATAAPRMGPLIPLRNEDHSGDWLRWFTLSLVALGSAVAGYYLMPLLRHL